MFIVIIPLVYCSAYCSANARVMQVSKKIRLWRIFMNTCLCISIYWQTWGPRASLTGDVDKVTILSKVRSSTVKGAGKQRYLHTHTPHSSFILQSPCGAWIQYIRTTRNWALPLWPAGKSSKPSIPWASSAWNRQCNMWSQYIFRSIKLRLIDETCIVHFWFTWAFWNPSYG